MPAHIGLSHTQFNTRSYFASISNTEKHPSILCISVWFSISNQDQEQVQDKAAARTESVSLSAAVLLSLCRPFRMYVVLGLDRRSERHNQTNHHTTNPTQPPQLKIGRHRGHTPIPPYRFYIPIVSSRVSLTLSLSRVALTRMFGYIYYISIIYVSCNLYITQGVCVVKYRVQYTTTTPK